MVRRAIGRSGRVAAFAIVVALVFSLAGDRGRAATGSSVVNGQDPLEVLSLKIRPNVFIVLDSSGSMTSDVTETTNTRSGDHPRSKMFQAKQVMSTVVQQNQDKASFLFGTYTQLDEMGGSYHSLQPNNLQEGNDRFQYSTSSDLSPNMTSTELRVRRASGDTNDRGFQSWQIIDAQWNTLYFDEDASTDAVCAAVVPGPYPRFFQTGEDLANTIEAAMNSASCTGNSRTNTYNGFYDEDDGDFHFARSSGSRSFRIRWGQGPNNIRNALAETSTGTTGWTTGEIVTDFPWTLLFRNGTGNSGTGMSTDFHFQEEIPRGSGTLVTFYQLRAGRLWNGETIKVEADGTVCDIVFPTAAEKTNPPSVKLQLVQNGCGADVAGDVATFTFAGADFGGNNRNCRGFQPTVALIPCDLQSPPAPLQITTISPFLDTEVRFNADGSPRDYSEVMDGGWDGAYSRPPIFTDSAKAEGNTPIANTLIDIMGLAEGSQTYCFDPVDGTTEQCEQRGFDKLWNVGQAGSATSAGSPPYQLDPIRNHVDPKEKTIVLFVTDGDDTCYNRGDGGSSANMDDNARRAAFWAEKLYTRKDATDPASSVETFVIGFGGGTPYRLDWIAWGGSGLGQGLPGQPQIAVQDGTDAYPPNPLDQDVRWNGNDSDFRSARAGCTTCRDAFLAPDADTLAATLQAIIDQGAQIGEFSSQQSLTQSVFEYADVGGADAAWPQIRPGEGRYEVLVPTRIVSTFSLPGFNGQLRAYQSDGATPPNSVLKWSAGDVLQTQVASGMLACDTSSVGGSVGQCGFGLLHANATDTTVWNSTAAIKRRVYTTDRNGVYGYDPTSLMAGTANNRVTLWPPESTVAPNDYTSAGLLDTELGLPADSPTCTLVPPNTSCAQQELARLKNQYNACVGSNLPTACTGGGVTSQMQAARREAREMILAFMAGAKAVLNTGTPGVARTSSATSGVPANSVLYQVRNWILADSQLATPAVVAPPAQQAPEATSYTREYELFRDGPRDSGGTNPDSGGSQLYQGFGLRNPDADGTVTTPDTPDTRAGLKPAMTVVFAPANDMLHAFRAGPNCSPDLGTCTDLGGEELWGFVPYDQLSALPARLVNEPQGRDNHVYMLARGVRFADVFVPELPGPLTNVSIGGVTEPSMLGVWRRVLFFGRGIGGKHVTALDVTGTGPYTQRALRTGGPIPLWNRGNPDSPDGVASNPSNNGTALDRIAYSRMGETWSLPSVGYIDRTTGPLYTTTRRPDGVEFILQMGSGYGAPTEGSTFYTLDALSGDVIGAADVEVAAGNNGLLRTGLTYPNSIVANVVGFNPSAFPILQGFHPANDYVRRVYFGDTHGRLWKVLASDPDVAIPVADLGEDQPVGTAASLLGLPPSQTPPPNPNVIPHVFVSTGNDIRADGPFANFGFRDDGTDFDTSVGAGVTTVTTDGVTVTTFPPAVSLFGRFFDQGLPEADCGYTEEAVFRGTVQPATTFECLTVTGGNCNDPVGRVFFAGTRLSLPNTVFAPPTPFACGIGDYPCRSQFDSIIYALGAVTGQAAYDLNASGDDAYRIFRDSRIAAIGMQADPDPSRGGASFAADEGLVKGTPAPPPPAGVPPTSTTATASVLMTRDAGQAPPAVRYGSTVCQ